AGVTDRRAGWKAGCHIPEPHRPVRASGEEGSAARAERDGGDLLGMRDERAKGPARRRVPEACRAIATAGENHLAVGAEGGRVDRTGMGEDRLELGMLLLPGGQIRACRVLPGEVACRASRAPALGHPVQSRADLAALERRLTAIEVTDREESIRLSQ